MPPKDNCAVIGCPRTKTSTCRVGFVVRPTGSCSYQLMPIDVLLCPDHADIVTPAADLSMYSIEWEGR